MQKIFMIIAAASALLAISLGAFGAHALKGNIETSMLVTFQTGVQYQFYHSLALLLLAILLFNIQNRWLITAGCLFITGIFLFSGSLYILSISSIRWIGIITPLGGLSLICGWLLLLIGILKTKL